MVLFYRFVSDSTQKTFFKIFFQMEISEIKARLPMAQVLAHYGLKPDKNGMLCCPFHEDRTPSMQVYHKTDTCYCFSSNCKTHGKSMDVIDLIMHQEGSSKHSAILQAVKMINGGTIQETTPTGAVQTGAVPTDAMPTRTTLLSRVCTYFRNGFQNSTPAKEYVKQRGLDIGKTEVGYNSGQLHHGKRDLTLIAGCEKYGLLTGLGKKSSTGNPVYKVFGKGCIVFPMKNSQGGTVSLYFRSIHDTKTSRHFYLKDRQGLYPKYPESDTQKLILTESVIDAATLLEQEKIRENFTILALYGTNGLTTEHGKAITALEKLQEIILFFDGDAAGKKAAEKQGEYLQGLLPKVKISIVETPEGEDVNSLITSHEPEILEHLIKTRKLFSSTEKEKTLIVQNHQLPHQTTNGGGSRPEQQTSLDTTNPHNLHYSTETATYYIKGGIRKELDSLKVTLVIEHIETRQKSRNKLDLYEDRQTEKVAREASEKLQLRPDMVEHDLHLLTDLLDEHREQQQPQAEDEEAPKKVILTPVQKEACTEFLKRPDLLQHINEMIGKSGVVGEENNRLFLFGIASSYKMEDTLHALIQGSSGSGKTHLLAAIMALMPPEDTISLTRITESSLYNYGRHELRHKLLGMEDLDGLEEKAELAFRELQSKGAISSSTSGKDERTGEISAFVKTVEGPIASLSATTKGEVYEDNMSRCFLVAVDESHEQTLRIIKHQNDRAAGGIDKKEEKEIKAFLQNCMRLLKPYEVVNPFANKIDLPKEAHKIRRLNDLFQSYVKQVTLLNQYQRKKDKYGRLITDKEDIRTAITIMFDSIILKVDELDGSLRDFYERLKRYVVEKGRDGADRRGTDRQYEFIQREVRHALKMSKTQLFRYIHQLETLEYLQKRGIGRHGAVKYKIVYWDDNSAMRAKIKQALEQQLEWL